MNEKRIKLEDYWIDKHRDQVDHWDAFSGLLIQCDEKIAEQLKSQILQDGEFAIIKCGYCGKSVKECFNNHVHYCKREIPDDFWITDAKAEKDHEIVNRLRERIEEIYEKYMGVNDGLSEEEIYLVEQTLPELQKIMETKHD